MHTVTAHTLAYDLAVALRHGNLPEAIATHLQGDLDRWEQQQADPDAGAAIFRQWATDRDYFIRTLAQLDPHRRRQMARCYVAFLRRYGDTDLNDERMLVVWQREIDRLAQPGADTQGLAIEHGPSTNGRSDTDTTTDMRNLSRAS